LRAADIAKLIEVTLAIAAYQRDGGPTAVVSPIVERLLGRPPLTIEEFVRDHLNKEGKPACQQSTTR